VSRRSPWQEGVRAGAEAQLVDAAGIVWLTAPFFSTVAGGAIVSGLWWGIVG